MYQNPGFTRFEYRVYGNTFPEDDSLIDLSEFDGPAYVNSGNGDDTVTGTDHNDYLNDWQGDDILDGGAGDDKIEGGEGSDTLTGSEGYDAFFFGGTGWNDGDADVITDFSFDEDGLIIRGFDGFVGAKIFSLDDLLAQVSANFGVMFTTEGISITLRADGGAAQTILIQNPQALQGATEEAPEAFTPPTVIVMTYGQSLAVGTTSWADRDLLNPTALYPDLALELEFSTTTVQLQDADTFLGLTAMVETKWETVGSGMINRVIAEHQANGYLSPTFIHTNTAMGGRSVLELLTSSDEIFGSVADGLTGTETGDHFAVRNADGLLEHYVDTGTEAYHTATSTAKNSEAYFDTFATHMALAVQAAQADGQTVNKQIMLNWIQGQADVHLAAKDYDYAYHLDLLMEKASDVAKSVLGEGASVLASVSQHRGYASKSVAIQQLEVATEDGFAYFGIPEYYFETAYPSKIGYDYTHLSSEGYFMAGQTLGLKMYDALTGQVNDPILISDIEMISETEMLVSVTGADGGLVYDPSGYSSDTATIPPSYFGFGLYTDSGVAISDGPAIIDAVLLGEASVLLTFDTALGGDYRLYLGRNEEDLIEDSAGTYNGFRFGGTTLRSAEIDTAVAPTGGQILADDQLYEFAPIQFVTISVTDTPEV